MINYRQKNQKNWMCFKRFKIGEKVFPNIINACKCFLFSRYKNKNTKNLT